MELVGRDTGLPLSEAVFRSLCQALQAGLYRPGDRLRDEEVAPRLKVSRTKRLLGPAEGSAARLATCLEAGDDAIVDLEEAFDAHAGDPVEMARLYRTLHETIFRAVRNGCLDGALQEPQDAIALLGLRPSASAGHPSAAEEHRDLIEAIATRDPHRGKVARLHNRKPSPLEAAPGR